MPREIYNEGRVIGLSAYEIYLREFLTKYPDGTPATEQEWLASSIAMGSSLLLEVPENTGMDGFWFIDIDFPINSTLCAANTIIASYFFGTGHTAGMATVLNHTDDPDFVVGSWGWRRPAYSYGKLLPDGSGYYKEENPSDFPTGNNIDITISDKQGLLGYMQFVDGLVLQPGTRNAMTFDPMLGDENKPCLRFLCNGKIQGRFRMLLTGFTLKSIIQGISKTKVTGNLSNGEFLGPSAYPWANKIIFTTPNAYVNQYLKSDYIRGINQPDRIVVPQTPIIDMLRGSSSIPAPVLENYYGKDTEIVTDKILYPGGSSSEYIQKRKDSKGANVQVKECNADGNAIFTIYQKNNIYPPALYGTFVDSTSGDHYLHPVDIVAPGSIKAFINATPSQLEIYQNTFPATHAINIKEDGTVQTIDTTGSTPNIVTMSKSTDSVTISASNLSDYAWAQNIKVGNGIEYKSIALTNNSGQPLSVLGQDVYSDSDLDYKKFNWRVLLKALKNNYWFDLVQGTLTHVTDYVSAGDGIKKTDSITNGITLSLDKIKTGSKTVSVNIDQTTSSLFRIRIKDSTNTYGGNPLETGIVGTHDYLRFYNYSASEEYGMAYFDEILTKDVQYRTGSGTTGTVKFRFVGTDSGYYRIYGRVPVNQSSSTTNKYAQIVLPIQVGNTNGDYPAVQVTPIGGSSAIGGYVSSITTSAEPIQTSMTVGCTLSQADASEHMVYVTIDCHIKAWIEE